MPDGLCPMVLVHIPKTGGTSAASALGKLFSGQAVRGFYDALPLAGSGFAASRLVASHARFADLQSVEAKAIFVTAIRRPVDRIVSIFRFWSSIRVEECVANGRLHLLKNKQRTFQDFLLAEPESRGMHDNEMVRQFADVSPDRLCSSADLQVAIANLTQCVAILRTEHLDDDLRDLFQRLKCENLFEPARLNVTDANSDIQSDRYEAPADVDLAALSEDAMSSLHQLTFLDSQLYDWACSRIEDLRSQPLQFAIERPTMARGETILPCNDPAFRGLLAGGWGNVEAEGIVWSVEKNATVAFQTANEKSAQLTLTFEGCLIAARTHLRLEIAYGNETQVILLLQQGSAIKGDIAVGVDRIFVAPMPAKVTIDLDMTRTDHTVQFRLPSLSSPIMLGHNSDVRPLGIRLASLELA